MEDGHLVVEQYGHTRAFAFHDLGPAVTKKGLDIRPPDVGPDGVREDRFERTFVVAHPSNDIML